MATYGRSGEVRKMGLGALVMRGALGMAGIAAAGMLYASVLNPVMDWVRKDNAVVEQGFVNPKSLDIQSKKNAAGNIESYLQYKNGDEAVSLPCMKGYSGGALCGTIDYWLENLSPEQKEGVVVGQWPSISSNAKRGILGTEIQAMLDALYGAQKAQQQYATPGK